MGSCLHLTFQRTPTIKICRYTHIRFPFGDRADSRRLKLCKLSFLVSADGKYIPVGLYQLQTGKIIWKGYDDILWAGKEDF